MGPIEDEVVWRVLRGRIQNCVPVDAPLDKGVEPIALELGHCSLIAIPEPLERVVDLDRVPVDRMRDRFDRANLMIQSCYLLALSQLLCDVTVY